MSEWLWETDILIEAMRARPMGGPLPEGVTGISIDTRTLKRGEAFFAIAGDRFDGHDFLTAASKAGSALHVVSERKLAALGRVQSPMLVVDDVLAALGRLAQAARARARARIVAVTGSVGKTTTKEALRHGLSACGTVHASAASFNNHWGVPLSLARLPADARFAVFEIGMNHPDEIRPLVKLVRPHAAMVTLIAPAHLGHFKDLDGIADAKAEIFEGIVPGGTALVNADDPKCMRLAGAARAAGVSDVRTFGEAPGADFRLVSFTSDGEGARMEAEIGEKPVSLHLPMGGRHIAQNILAVLGSADILGADVATVAERLSTWRAVKGRGERHKLTMPGGGAVTLIDDSYNANPASMRAALDTVARIPLGEGGRKIAVLGDMKELGGHSQAMHAELAEPILAAGIDKLFMVGEEMKALDEAVAGRLSASWHEDAAGVADDLMASMRAGDAIVVKGSRSIGLEKVVEALRGRFGAEAEEGPAKPEPNAPIEISEPSATETDENQESPSR